MPRASVKTPVPDEAVPPADGQAPTDDAPPPAALEHVCHTADGQDVPCRCVRGVDHDEAEFDVPLKPADGADQTEAADPAPSTDTPPDVAPTGFVVVATIFQWVDENGRKQRARKGDTLDGLPTSVVDRGLRNGTLAQQD